MMGKQIPETSVLYWLVLSCTQIYREGGAQTKVDIQKTVPSVDGNVCPHQSFKSHPKWRKTKQNKRKNKSVKGRNQTPVGARRLMKAILLRHILLKKTGQAGFMMKCSRRIRNSVNRVRQ